MASHECQICGQQFTTAVGLNMHTVRMHRKSTQCAVNVGKHTILIFHFTLSATNMLKY